MKPRLMTEWQVEWGGICGSWQFAQLHLLCGLKHAFASRGRPVQDVQTWWAYGCVVFEAGTQTVLMAPVDRKEHEHGSRQMVREWCSLCKGTAQGTGHNLAAGFKRFICPDCSLALFE